MTIWHTLPSAYPWLVRGSLRGGEIACKTWTRAHKIAHSRSQAYDEPVLIIYRRRLQQEPRVAGIIWNGLEVLNDVGP